jgi:tetratricopeptide (TPR) repeat protein
VAVTAFADHAESGSRLFTEGERAYNIGKFMDAIDRFSKAYVKEPRPALLFDIGQCYRQLKNYTRAAFFFERYLELVPGSTVEDSVNKLLDDVHRRAATEVDRRSAETSWVPPELDGLMRPDGGGFPAPPPRDRPVSSHARLRNIDDLIDPWAS